MRIGIEQDCAADTHVERTGGAAGWRSERRVAGSRSWDP